MKERNHVLNILEQTKKAVEKKNVVKLKELSNQTIHSASIYQDTESVLIAVIIYSLSKVVERTNYQKYKDYNSFVKSFIKHIKKARTSLKNNQEKEFRQELKNVRKEISKISGNFKKHLEQVFKKSSINKASRIYEHGISMEKTADLLGISAWQLAEYAGKTGIADVDLSITMTVKKRIKLAEQFFN